jgi:hypothetical protein
MVRANHKRTLFARDLRRALLSSVGKELSGHGRPVPRSPGSLSATFAQWTPFSVV